MNTYLDGTRLSRLIAGLQALSGIGIRLLDGDGRELCAGGGPDPFCAQLQSSREGAIRCQNCAAEAARAQEDASEVCFVRCHAGTIWAILPVRSSEAERPLAFLCGGPLLDAAPSREYQWDSVRAGLDWFPGGADSLRPAFLRLRPCGPFEREALAATMEAMADYALARNLIRPAGETDARRLSRFLDEHYMEKLTLASISARLHIGRTRLCALAKELPGGQTLSAMIARRRIDAAKELLIRTDRPVSAIAEAVGVSDYNYFSKIFRAAVGTSPSEFRKRARRELDTLD